MKSIVVLTSTRSPVKGYTFIPKMLAIKFKGNVMAKNIVIFLGAVGLIIDLGCLNAYKSQVVLMRAMQSFLGRNDARPLP